MEYNLINFLSMLKRKLPLTIFLSTIVGISTFFFCEFLNKYYSLEVLISSGKIQEFPEKENLAGLNSKFLDSSNPIKDDAKNFIEFKYMNKLDKKKYKEAYVNSLEDLSNSNFLKIEIYALSLDLANDLFNQIYSDLKEKFSNQINQKKRGFESVIALNKENINKLLDSKETLENIIIKVGHNPSLYEKLSKIEQDIIGLEVKNLEIENYLSSENIKDFKIVSSKNSGHEIVFPKSLIFSFVAFTFTFATTIYLLALMDQAKFNIKTQIIQNKNESDNTNQNSLVA